MNAIMNEVVAEGNVEGIVENVAGRDTDAYTEKNWTVMVYLSGDSNLNVEMAYAVEQMRAVTKDNKNISLYVYFDGFSEDVPTMYCDFSGTKSEYFQSRHIPDKVFTYNLEEDEFNENSAAVTNVINFIDWCVKKDRECKMPDGSVVDRRAEKNYAIIFSGHSFGFMDWGLFKDQKADYSMTMSKLAWMFERVTDKEGILIEKAKKDQAYGKKKGWRDWSEAKYEQRTAEILGKPFSLLGFDSCVLSTLEISSQFEGLTETIVSSEGSIPTAGWNYAQILLGKIRDESVRDPKAIAVSFVDEFIKQQGNFSLADISVDMAAWDLSAMPALRTAFSEWALALHTCFKDDSSVEYNQLRRLLTYAHWQSQTYLLEQHVDLGDLCELMIGEIDMLEKEIDGKAFAQLGAIRIACQTVLTESRNVIILSGFSGRDYQFSNGISIFFPWSWQSYECARKDYKKLLINRANRWDEKGDATGANWIAFLERYLGYVTYRRAKVLTPVDSSGQTIVVPGVTKSVVYESFKILGKGNTEGSDTVTGGKVEPDTLKVEPNTMKVEPNTMRVEPNTMKMYSVMGILLRHFGAVKNIGSSWTRAGFTSSQIDFHPVSGSAGPGAGNSISIPRATDLQSAKEKIFAALRERKVNDNDLAKLQELIEANRNSDGIDEPASIEMLANLSHKLNRVGAGLIFSLPDTLKSSIMEIKDPWKREKILSDFGSIM
ncbi:MAG: clostripain-related cysteine peptidase [Pyrinomonadaceae bacterium]